MSARQNKQIHPKCSIWSLLDFVSQLRGKFGKGGVIGSVEDLVSCNKECTVVILQIGFSSRRQAQQNDFLMILAVQLEPNMKLNLVDLHLKNETGIINYHFPQYQDTSFLSRNHRRSAQSSSDCRKNARSKDWLISPNLLVVNTIHSISLSLFSLSHLVRTTINITGHFYLLSLW